MESAHVIVIGGGIAGCSVAFHLARAGWRDVLLIEKGELTSGSTHHAAGLVTQFNPSATMMRFRRYSVSVYRELGVFSAVGSVRIASSPDSLRDLQRAASRARALGLDAELIGPEEVLERLPFASAGEPVRRGVDGGRRSRRPPHRDVRSGGRRARGRRPLQASHRGHRDRTRAATRGPRRPHRRRADRDRARHQRRRGLGATGCGDGRGVVSLGAGRSPARAHAGGAG